MFQMPVKNNSEHIGWCRKNVDAFIPILFNLVVTIGVYVYDYCDHDVNWHSCSKNFLPVWCQQEADMLCILEYLECFLYNIKTPSVHPQSANSTLKCCASFSIACTLTNPW